jgi:hypothetical protein
MAFPANVFGANIFSRQIFFPPIFFPPNVFPAKFFSRQIFPPIFPAKLFRELNELKIKKGNFFILFFVFDLSLLFSTEQVLAITLDIRVFVAPVFPSSSSSSQRYKPFFTL